MSGQFGHRHQAEARLIQVFRLGSQVDTSFCGVEEVRQAKEASKIHHKNMIFNVLTLV